MYLVKKSHISFMSRHCSLLEITQYSFIAVHYCKHHKMKILYKSLYIYLFTYNGAKKKKKNLKMDLSSF